MSELSLIVKATVIITMGLAVVRLSGRAPAALRHLVLAATFGMLLMLPAASALFPPSMAIEIPMSPARSIPFIGAAEPVSRAAARADTAALTPSRGDAGLVRAQQSSAAVSGVLGSRALIRGAWAVSALLFLFPIASALARLRDIRRSSVPWRDGEALVLELAVASGIGRHVEARLHDAVVTPLTFGLSRPVLLFPPDVREWSAGDIRHAVSHELEHVRRFDWPIGLAARAVCALYWFHPLAWVARRRLILESERACDDAVLRTADCAAYAQQLVDMAARMVAPAPRAALLMAGRGDLSARIAAVLNARLRRGPTGFAATAGVATTACALMLIIAAPRISAQPPAGGAGSPVFVSASIKPSALPSAPIEARVGEFMGPPARNRFAAMGVSLGTLIRYAYQVSPFEMSGGPDWIESASFDVDAHGDTGATQQQMRMMMRGLLSERFELAVHTETEPRAAYALVRSGMYDGLGPELVRSAGDCARSPEPDFHEYLKEEARGRPACGTFWASPYSLAATGVSLQSFAVELASARGIDRPVVDRTGLAGNFDLGLQWTPQQGQIFELIQQELGLALEPANEPVSVLVIDRAERPASN